MQVVGITSDDHILKMATVALQKGRIRILSSQEMSHSYDEKAVRKKGATIATGLSAHEVVLRTTMLPLPSIRKALSVLPFQLETLLPFPSDQIIACPFFHTQAPRSIEVTIIATSTHTLEMHLRSYQALNIHPDTVSCAPAALSRLGSWLYPQKKHLLLFHCTKHKTTCVLIENGKISVSQSLKMGTSDLFQALKEAFPEQTEGERIRLLPSSLSAPHAPLLHFKTAFSRELEKFLLFLSDKGKQPEQIPWLFLGEVSEEPALGSICREIYGKEELVLPPLEGVASSTIHTYALSIGYALDALFSDKHSVQLNRGLFTPKHHKARRKKLAGIYAALCCGFSILLGVASHILLDHKTTVLSEKLRSYQPLKKAVAPTVSLRDLEEEIGKWEQSLHGHHASSPFFLNVPKVSDLLAWISTHPVLSNADGISKDGIHIESIRYQLVKYPSIHDPSSAYQAQAELQFTAATPRLAREFHEAILKGDRIANGKKEVKWHASGTVYSIGFELQKMAIP